MSHRVSLVLPIILGVAALGITSINGQTSQSGTPPDNPIHWEKGPFTAKLGDNAEIDIPKEFLFADGTGARKYMELSQNPVSGSEVGLIAPKSEHESWFILFEFDGVGYVKDDDKASLDSGAILQSIKKATEDSNEVRRKKNWPAFHVNSWHTAPFYDSVTQNLTWAINGSEDNGVHPAINYSVRILGRRGTMNVDLVGDPQDLASAEPRLKTILEGFRFTGGNRYADFAEGDKLAGYGLTALIAGGATAVAIKTGLFAKLWKFLVIIVVAIVGYLKKLWRKTKTVVSGERDPSEEFPTSTPKE
ncbi:MAG: DUF2167 domain-containing protein [Terracidiphilus sp.]